MTGLTLEIPLDLTERDGVADGSDEKRPDRLGPGGPGERDLSTGSHGDDQPVIVRWIECWATSETD